MTNRPRYLDAELLAKEARHARESRGLTQAEAADQLGVSQSSISRAERGDDGFDALRVRMIEVLGGHSIEPLWLITRRRGRPPGRSR